MSLFVEAKKLILPNFLDIIWKAGMLNGSASSKFDKYVN
jgi:hypothetical protein